MSMHVQHTIKQNMEELQSYLSDLNTWTNDMEKKDKELINNKQTSKLPPVRGTDNFGEALSQPVQEKKEKQPPKKTEIIFEQDTKKDNVDQESLDLKEKGNEAFKKKDFQKAIEWYTKSLQVKEDAVVYCNRATTYYKLGKFSDSERDATKCVTLNHAYAKGYARRGAARRELKNLEGSIADFEKALTVAPNTKEYEKELETSKKALEEAKRATSKRMIIEEVEEDTKPIKVVEEEEIEELITPQASKIQASQPKPVPKQEPKPQPKPEPVKQVPKQEPARQPTSKHVSQVPTQPPKTSYEFEKNLKGLSTQGIQEYIWLIPPESFKSLFKEALTGEIMSTIIHAVESYFLPKEGGYARAVSVLENLAKAERFDITVMFLEDEERKVVEKICQVVEKNTQLSTDTIRKSYL